LSAENVNCFALKRLLGHGVANMTNDKPNEQLESRTTDLEIGLTHQNELLEQLNEVIYAQQKQIDLLEKKMTNLEKQVGDPTAPVNEKPPHY
jgi:SlyX protein